MNKIYTLLSGYIRYEIKATYIYYLLLFLIPAIALNYYYNFENGILNSFRDEWGYFFLCLLYYSIPLLYAVLVYIFLYNKKQLLKEKKFLFLILFFPVIIAFDEAFNFHKQWVSGIENEIVRYYAKKTLNHAIRLLTFFLPILVYYIFYEKQNKNFYGLAPSKVDLKPYLIMLFGVMMPLIILASYTTPFQEAYPVFDMSKVEGIPLHEYWLPVFTFEVVYLFDFINIELLFRGIMIYTLYQYMGIECVLAVSTLYCTFHFGKPMAETISSFIGGTILGVFSLRTQSLYGGIMIHAGIALMMDTSSLFQKI
jgi:membrane protease YdiL (CAAX protease family)